MERKENKFLSLDEARKNPGMHELSRMELDYVRNRFLCQFEDFASRLLPDPALIKNKVYRIEASKRVIVNPLQDEFFA